MPPLEVIAYHIYLNSAMHEDIIIVSGLPRSGTSLMMQMLNEGGIAAMTDHVRMPDTDNPRGYYEFEAVKRIKLDASWLPSARGKVVKAVSRLLYDFPVGERYRVVFMERDLDEMLRSQEKMLIRLGRTPVPADKMKESYVLHLRRLYDWFKHQSHMQVLVVRYNDLMANPADEANRVNEFLGGALDIEKMVAAVDPSLYRNRAMTGP